MCDVELVLFAFVDVYIMFICHHIIFVLLLCYAKKVKAVIFYYN